MADQHLIIRAVPGGHQYDIAKCFMRPKIVCLQLLIHQKYVYGALGTPLGFENLWMKTFYVVFFSSNIFLSCFRVVQFFFITSKHYKGPTHDLNNFFPLGFKVPFFSAYTASGAKPFSYCI